MAVLSEVPGLTVTVDVAGEDLAEYDDDESDKSEPRTATKYVEAHSGANFGIATRIDAATFAHPSDTIRLKMYLDGNFVSAWSLKQETLSRGRRTVMNYTGQIDGDREIRMKFSFAELQTSENGVGLTESQQANLSLRRRSCGRGALGQAWRSGYNHRIVLQVPRGERHPSTTDWL